MKLGTLQIALATIGALVVSGSSLAQEIPEVVIEVPHVEKSTQPGHMGPAPALSIVYKVNYADLNLATHTGAVALEARIKDSATRACQQLATLFPTTVEAETPCVQGAMKNAMEQAKKAIAAAEKAKT